MEVKDDEHYGFGSRLRRQGTGRRRAWDCRWGTCAGGVRHRPIARARPRPSRASRIARLPRSSGEPADLPSRS